ncbi:MAG TPA: suppressor of fused domain protein [Myxococcaceae bacterium]|nr:suppressor of fused domain protein [Myxococcaceae bacterium]
MNAPENEAEWAAWYQQAWDVRDDQLYRELFPTMTGEIVTLGDTDALEAWLSSDLAQVSEIDPAWKSFGVRVAPPDENRPVWTYVTSGLSNPFTVGPGDAFDPEGPSGIGYELVIHTPEEARWPILRLLDMMAYNLVCLKAFATGSRFSVEGTLDGRPETKLSGFLFAEDDEIAWGFGLPSGMVQLLVAVGVTRNELAFSRSNGAPRLLEKLAEAGLGVRTVIDREELKL